MAESIEGLEELFQQTWLDHVLHYSLLVGAIFQLVCIAAIVVFPPRPDEESEGDDTDGIGEGGGDNKEDHSPTGSKNGQLSSSAKQKKGKGARKRR